MERRVLILAPFGRDADVIAEVLTRDERVCVQCADVEALNAAGEKVGVLKVRLFRPFPIVKFI